MVPVGKNLDFKKGFNYHTAEKYGLLLTSIVFIAFTVIITIQPSQFLIVFLETVHINLIVDASSFWRVE